MFVAVLSVGFTYGWLYFLATHGPRLLGQSVAWFDGKPALDARLRIGAVSTGFALLGCFALGVVACFGIPSEHPTARVMVLPDSPADRAGVQTGDLIVAIDSRRIESFDQIRAAASSAGPLRLEVLRQNEALHIEVTPEDQRLGVQSIMKKSRRTASQAFEFTVATFARTASSLLQPTQSTMQLSGPVGVMRATNEVGARSILYLTLLLQASLWLVVPLLHVLDFLTLVLSRGLSDWSSHRRDVFNLLSLGASLLVLSVWGFALEMHSDAPLNPLLGFSTKAWGLALSLASFTALKRHLPLRRAGALAAVGAFVGPILWIGTLIWIRRQARTASI